MYSRMDTHLDGQTDMKNNLLGRLFKGVDLKIRQNFTNSSIIMTTTSAIHKRKKKKNGKDANKYMKFFD